MASSQLSLQSGKSSGKSKLLPLIGLPLLLISIGYIVWEVSHNWDDARQALNIDPAAIVTAGLLYLATHFTSSTAWLIGLRATGASVPFKEGLAQNLLAQAGKYVPGNVAHFLARAGLASQAGVAFGKSGIATLFEIVAVILGCAFVASTVLLFDRSPLSVVNGAISDASAGAIVVAFLLFVSALLFLKRKRIPASALVLAVACMSASFIAIGLSMGVLVSSMATGSIPYVALIGIYATAWIAGYLVPGAPAGLGVREAILMAWLSPMIGTGPALACTLLHRLITTVVDILVAICAYGWLRLGSRR